jgi:hypothetical protein
MSSSAVSPNSVSPLDRALVFYGDHSPASAHVYVWVPELRHEDGWSMAITVRGPECALAHTLPATVRGADMGPGEGLLARVMLPDPCYWSPQLPALYHVTIELHQHGDDVEAVDRVFGLRLLGPRGKSLYLDQSRWVPRGIRHEMVEPVDLAQWRDASAVMLARDPDDALCEAASRQGVLVIALLEGDAAHIQRELARVARHAAVAVAVVGGTDLDKAALRQSAPNVLLAPLLDPKQPARIPSWARLAMVQVDDPSTVAAFAAPLPVPVFAYRPLSSPTTLAEARQACDHLQRDLAPTDFAGYLV